jgi:cell filamentation protein
VSFHDPYTYPRSTVLRNRFGITNATELDRVERRLVTARIAEGVPTGGLDLPHLRAIHRHLFQDIYDWAGELRTVEITKGDHQFQFCRFMQTGMADVHRRLDQGNFLRGLSPEDFANAAGPIIADVNYVHPFREGNGRTQLFYLQQLADQAGHPLDLARLNPAGWIAASRAAHDADYTPMIAEIARAILGGDR